MVFPDLTPIYLAPSPAERLLRIVRKKVNELWLYDRRLADVRPSAWDELVLAARYFHLRREVLEDFLGTHAERTRDQPFYKRLTLLTRELLLSDGVDFMTVLLACVVFSLVLVNLSSDIAAVERLYLSTMVILSVWLGALSRADWRVGPAVELAEIATFDHLVPSAVNMASHEEVTPSTAQEIEAVAHSSPGAPVTPPGLTELTLSRDNDSLRSIRDQLRTTRLVDAGMTIVSFLAFIAGIIFCFWQLIETDRIAQGMIGVGGSGLVGLFCFYSTGRARSSQIALGLFESLVAELTLALDGASRAAVEERRQMERAAWREFRIGLNDLYLLDRNQRSQKKPARGKSPSKL